MLKRIEEILTSSIPDHSFQHANHVTHRVVSAKTSGRQSSGSGRTTAG